MLATDMFHGLDRAVALLARDIRRDVSAVVEIREIREVVDLVPTNGLRPFYVLQEFRDLGFDLSVLAFGLNLGVAVHASGHGWNEGMRPTIRSCMTVETVYLQGPGVELVTERDRLRRLIPRLTAFGPENVGPERHP